MHQIKTHVSKSHIQVFLTKILYLLDHGERLNQLILDYCKTSNKRLASNKSRPLIGAECTGILNLKKLPLINICL